MARAAVAAADIDDSSEDVDIAVRKALRGPPPHLPQQ
jgi:hypothetical protein